MENRDEYDIKLLQLLFQKSGKYLENIGFQTLVKDELKQILLELVKNYCVRVKVFDLKLPNIQSIYLAIDSIKNINHLHVEARGYGNNYELGSTVLLNLGQILPYKLEYLFLQLREINTSDLETFLKNSRNTFSKKLVITIIDTRIDDILPCIKEHIIKGRRVKYLAIEQIRNFEFLDLSSMVHEVKKFESYDIKVEHCHKLYIDEFQIYKLINKMY